MESKTEFESYLRGEDGTCTCSLRLTEELFDTIMQMSEETGCKKNRMINLLLQFAVDNYSRNQK